MDIEVQVNPSTPRRIYCQSNICTLCGFAFILKVIEPGRTFEKKFLNKKLKLNEERISKICSVVSDFQEPADSSNGVCIKCFRHIEKVLQMQLDITKMQEELNTARYSVRKSYHLTCRKSAKKSAEKRQAKSPLIHEPCKQQKTIHSVVDSLVLIHPTLPFSKDLVTDSTVSQIVPIVKKPARRALPFTVTKPTQKETIGPNLEGEVEVSVHFPSGKRSTFIYDESHKQICRAVFRGQNVEKCILDIIGKTGPHHVTALASKIVSDECGKLCKRGSGTMLQERSYKGIFNFSWDKFYKEIQLRAPNTLKIISSVVSNTVVEPNEKKFQYIMQTVASGLHGRSQEMSCLHYQIGFILTHGACKQRDIERLAKIGLSTTSKSVSNKLSSWDVFLDAEVMEVKKKWSEGGDQKYQLIGDNWDKNILPSYRTTQNRTISLHLFNVIAVIDRIIPEAQTETQKPFSVLNFIPSVDEQALLRKELTFIVATSVIENVEQMNGIFSTIYPKHLKHQYSDQAGIKTKQFPIGLFDCNENKTQELIRLLKDLSTKYVPMHNDEIVEEVFLGGDRLTDERVQGAQLAMANAATAEQRLQGFISKIEDWHRMMNFMEAICKLTYNTASQNDRGTAYYFRNVLNARNVKNEVKNAFRAYKMLYYTIFDAICAILFLREFGKTEFGNVELPVNFDKLSNEEKINWLNGICENIVNVWFFNNEEDICEEIRSVLENPDHEENYWIANMDNGRFGCHYCAKTYARVGSLKAHESQKHQHSVKTNKKRSKQKTKDQDDLYNYIQLFFKLTALLKNLDSSIDMADGSRCVRSAKYELPIFNQTNKLKYVIGCVHLIDLSENTLSPQQRQRLVANRTVNIQGGQNSNIALDEYLEMLNRDSKDITSGNQTKESIIAHSKQFPHLINYVKHFDMISEIKGRKGFHKLPGYKVDVGKVAKELWEMDAFNEKPRTFNCTDLSVNRNLYHNSFKGLSTMIHRHKPTTPFSRLRNQQY